jgi:hypothetical protein
MKSANIKAFFFLLGGIVGILFVTLQPICANETLNIYKE